jgi:hypothetical protein
MNRFAKYLSALVVLGLVPLVAAQPDPTAPAPADPAPAATVTVKANIKLSAAEMSTQIGTAEAEIIAIGRQMMHLKELATKAKDVIKLTCLNDKLIQYKAQVNIWDTNKGAFQVAASKTDAERETAYTAAMDTSKAVHVLGDEAKGCVGEPELGQESGVQVEHPPFPDDPTAEDPFDPVVGDIEPPGYASPFF